MWCVCHLIARYSVFTVLQGNWWVLSQALNALPDPALEAAIVEGLMVILPLTDLSWILWAHTGFLQFAAMLQE